MVLAYGPNDRGKGFRGKNLEFGGFSVIGLMFKVVCVKILDVGFRVYLCCCCCLRL
jgi:hypothetical protein